MSSVLEQPMQPDATLQLSSQPKCVACGGSLTPSSFGLAKLRATPPGRSRLRGGIPIRVYVCSSCGRVELFVDDPSAFA
jgi:hypothetical protein